MFGKHFIYDGHSSEEFNLTIASFDSNDEIPMGLTRNILKGETNRFRTSPNHMGTSYDDVLTFKVTLVKNPCKRTTEKDMYFLEDEIDNINAWLTSSDYPILFHMYDYDNENDHKYDYFGIFTDVETQTVGGRVIGLIYTFTTNSPYAFTEKIEKDFVCSGETNITIEVNSSERKREIYPVIKLLPTGDPLERVTITIKSITDNNRSMILKVLKEPIIIDCSKSMISDAVGLLNFEDLGISDLDYIYWLRLYHGINTFIVTGDVELTFEYREPRKVGAF